MKKAKSVQGRLESKNVTAEKDESIAQEIAHNKGEIIRSQHNLPRVLPKYFQCCVAIIM